MQELEVHALQVENKSCQDFLIAHQAVLLQALQSLKEDLHSSYSLLLGPLVPSPRSITPASKPQAEEQTLSTVLKSEPKWSPPWKRWHSSTDVQGDMPADEDFPRTSQEEAPLPKRGKTANWLTSMRPECADTFSWDSDFIKGARACYITTHPWDWAHGNMDDLSNIFKEQAQEAGLLGESIFEIQQLWKGPDHLQ